jgi:hypothetical protein
LPGILKPIFMPLLLGDDPLGHFPSEAGMSSIMNLALFEYKGWGDGWHPGRDRTAIIADQTRLRSDQPPGSRSPA